ncbi:hypothetical protein ABTL13_19290, partial [Acinetobacter baumannii]
TAVTPTAATVARTASVFFMISPPSHLAGTTRATRNGSPLMEPGRAEIISLPAGTISLMVD